MLNETVGYLTSGKSETVSVHLGLFILCVMKILVFVDNRVNFAIFVLEKSVQILQFR